MFRILSFVTNRTRLPPPPRVAQPRPRQVPVSRDQQLLHAPCTSYSSAPGFPHKRTERLKCPDEPPPPEQPKDESLLWGTIAAAILVGGFTVFAQNTPEVRDWLTIHAPWFDDFIAVVYQENMSYKEYAIDKYEKTVASIKEYFREPEEGECIKGTPPEKCICDDTPKKVIVKLKSGEKCEIKPPPILEKNICEVEDCVRDLGLDVVNNYFTAKAACKFYNAEVEECLLNFSVKCLKKLHELKEWRIKLVNESIEKAEKAQAELDELIRYFECGVKATPEELQKTRLLIKSVKDQIKASKIKYQWKNDKALIIDKEWHMVECTMDKYIEEHSSMFPRIDYTSKKPTIGTGDIDVFLDHALKYLILDREQVKEAYERHRERVNRAVDTLAVCEKDKKAKNDLIQAAYKKKKAEVDKAYQKRLDDQKAANDKFAQRASAKQLAKYEASLKGLLDKKEKEAKAKLKKMVADKVALEKEAFRKALKDMKTKVDHVEIQLNERLHAEREMKRSQELWSAGASLLAATKKGGKRICVEKELKALEKAGGGQDKLVLTVLKAIPDEVWTKGIVPESTLLARYHAMENVAIKVALVESEGGPWPIFVLSWIQSLFLFMKIHGIPLTEYENPPKEPAEDLDTFDLLQRARFWLFRGNLGQALRYVDSLQGASRLAANTWYESARAHLDTRQAAEAVVAHAAALGLKYI